MVSATSRGRFSASSLSPAPSRSFCFATVAFSRTSGDEWSSSFERIGSKSGTNAMSLGDETRAAVLPAETAAFLTNS